MTNSFSCKLPGCGYSTTFDQPDEVDQFVHFQLMDIHLKVGCVRHAANGFSAKVDKLELAMKPEDVTTSDANFDAKDDLVNMLKVGNEDNAVGNATKCRHCQGEAHGPDDKKTRKLLCPA